MGKYNGMKILKRTKSRTSHICNNCGNAILPNDFYYKEHIEDKFLHSLHAKKYCSSCYEKLGDTLLFPKEKSPHQNVSLETFNKT